jgi:hypothetical protein
MPFTFAHPAIVLPAACLPVRFQKFVCLTGLAAGAVAPDFEYFLRMDMKSVWSHTWSGLFFFDLPIGLALAFLFHNIVRGPLVASLPLFLESRFARAKDFRWNAYFKKRWVVVCVSVLVGSFSHILWDKFTHAGGFLPWPYYKIGQYASGVMGLLVIVFFVLRMQKDLSYTSEFNLKVKLTYWLIVSIVVIFVLAFRLSFGWTPSVAIASSISAGLVGVIVAGVAFSKPSKTRSR